MYRRDREQQRQQTRQAGQIQDRDEDDVLRGDKVLQVVLQVETILPTPFQSDTQARWHAESGRRTRER